MLIERREAGRESMNQKGDWVKLDSVHHTTLVDFL